jgi:hypothetical protein
VCAHPPFRRSHLTTLVMTACLFMAAPGCSRDDDGRWERWELRGGDTGAFGRAATFSLSWDDVERTTGDYIVSLTVKNLLQNLDVGTWELEGTLTAEHLSPDFCGRAKWVQGSECLRVTLSPDGDPPPEAIQIHLNALGLPDAVPDTHLLLFLDGKTRDMSLVRAGGKTRESRWRHVRSPE